MNLICSGALLLVGAYLTIRLRLFPIRQLGAALRSVFGSRRQKGSGTTFTVLCTSLAATLGTGNIVGVAAAIATGGPGAIFWMNIAAITGMSIKFSENALAVRYRNSDASKHIFSGPFCYMEAIGRRFAPLIATIFSIACLYSGILGMGTVTQANSVAQCVPALFGQHTVNFLGRNVCLSVLVMSFLLTSVCAFVILGDAKRIAQTAERIVPPMAVAYLAIVLYILLVHHHMILPALIKIVRSAFSLRSVGGGILGSGIARSLVSGVQRGVFSHEAGMGTSAIAASVSDVQDPVEQGYAGVVSVFIDTTILCTLTGLVIVIMDCWQGTENGVLVAEQALQTGLPFSYDFTQFILFLFLSLFGFTSIIGWNYYTVQSVDYLFGSRRMRLVYQMLYLIAVFLGPFVSVEFAWRIADWTNALMILPNLISLLLLRKEVVEVINK